MARPRSSDDEPEDILLQAFSGMRNTVSAERLGLNDLERALNVDLDNEGQPHRRRGYSKKASGEFHSLYRSSRGVYGVRDGVLVLIYPDYSVAELHPGIGPDPLACVEAGPDIFFASRTVSGVVHDDNTISSWGEDAGGLWHSPVVNPTATLGEIRGKILGPPPHATALLERDGRIYLANDRTLWATELWQYHYVDKTRNFYQFEAPITAMARVADGFYVGSEAGCWYCSGPFTQLTRKKVSASPVLPGSMLEVPAHLVRPETSLSVGAAVMLTESGLCVGLDNGVCYNITQDRFIFPQAGDVAAVFREQDGISQYVAVADSKGTPSSNTRIGDYVDAEIRRFQGV